MPEFIPPTAEQIIALFTEHDYHWVAGMLLDPGSHRACAVGICLVEHDALALPIPPGAIYTERESQARSDPARFLDWPHPFYMGVVDGNDGNSPRYEIIDNLDEDYARDYEPGYALGSAVRAHMLKG